MKVRLKNTRNKPVDFDVTNVISCQPMPDGWLLIEVLECEHYSHDIDNVVPVLDGICRILYHAFFKVKADNNPVVEMYGYMSNYDGELVWVSVDELKGKPINYRNYVQDCQDIGIQPLPLLDYWFCIQEEEDAYNLTRVPERFKETRVLPSWIEQYKAEHPSTDPETPTQPTNE